MQYKNATRMQHSTSTHPPTHTHPSTYTHPQYTHSPTQTQIRMGFSRVESQLDDVKLDCPHAPELFAKYKQQATVEQWLLADG